MRVNEVPQSSQPPARGEACVVIAADSDHPQLHRGLESLGEHTPAETRIVPSVPTAAGVNRAIEQLEPADVVLLCEPCQVSAGWLRRLRACALSDTNTATASALADAGTMLGLADSNPDGADFARLVDSLAKHTLSLRPRLNRVVGPCVYVRREALELVGPLDEQLDLRSALELDFAQRCLQFGLSHRAADDVVVGRLARVTGPDLLAESQELPERLRERYPYLSESGSFAASGVLVRALEAARQPRQRLWVTIDARALDGVVTGTQLHILELIHALAHTGSLRLRVIARVNRIDPRALELLRGLPESELLPEEEIGADTPRSTVYHRPQQMFAPEDIELAVRLGERIVVSQLDLIAYRNPGYFADAAAWEAYRRASRHGISAAERVVVFSDHTRRELLSDALAEEQRIRIVPPGLDHRSAGPAVCPAGLAEQTIGDYLLCLGTDFMHKNRVFAMRLLALLRERHGWAGTLVLAGTHIPHGSSRELEHAFLSEQPLLHDAIVQLGSVSEEEKAWLLGHASAVVYPSVFEGFGLVPFEAALSGVPCIFAAQSSLAEAAPPGAATILPWDPIDSAAAAHALLTNSRARSRHVEALTAAAADLTWARAADAMAQIYREAAVAPVRDAGILSRDAAERELELVTSHREVAQRLIDEREHEREMYERLNAEVGYGRSLVGPRGSLPEELQRALLALSARPVLSRPLYAAMSHAFIAARAVARSVRRGRGGAR